jgi:hypothetical protein
MANHESLPQLVEDLIGVMQLQAKVIEKLVIHIEHAVGKLPEEKELATLTSVLTELKLRAAHLGPRT